MIFLLSIGCIYARLIQLNQPFLWLDTELINRKVHFSQITMLTMVFKCLENAQLNCWYRLKGFNYLADIIRGVKFVNGTREVNKNDSVNEGIAA